MDTTNPILASKITPQTWQKALKDLITAIIKFIKQENTILTVSLNQQQ